ncbi:hypothetical protein F9U39_16235 [Pectobacterium versatile]|uniref:hypothetical protein n=1 Tax=Pectobacterium versatile TaxID=2488639 RepID=UPI001B39B2CC|nr:hypothetical protein [Pectobacterium versatile]MBQ4779080.1 hypothetical protein [Pectobacterium versatile]MBQ4783480.1 hypothetical protein [Pectobacterium versatile]MBQ4790979.1 hypothetical protein [Pectobacterium versatile]
MNESDAKRYEGIKYHLVKVGIAGVEKRSDWERHCGEKQIPCVCIKLQGSTSTVHFDYIIFDDELDELFVGEPEQKLQRAVLNLFADYATRFPSKMVCINAGMISTIQSVPNDVAPSLATALYDVVASYVMNELTENYQQHRTKPR